MRPPPCREAELTAVLYCQLIHVQIVRTDLGIFSALLTAIRLVKV